MRSFRPLLIVLVCFPVMALADSNPELFRDYQRLLSQHLIEKNLPGNGLVSAFDYQAAIANDTLNTTLAEQRAALAEFDPGELDVREEAVAFWINAYNFFMLEQILSERPDGDLVSSVWDYGGRVNPFVDNVFERKLFDIGGKDYSLNDMEKGILLGDAYAEKGWKDARIHFAVNCASVGCPPLRDTLYTADNLEQLLVENTRRAFSTSRHLKVEGSTLHVTELFKWYDEDFTDASGSATAFIEEWAEPAVAERVAGTNTLEFIDYDWTLNSPENFTELR